MRPLELALVVAGVALAIASIVTTAGLLWAPGLGLAIAGLARRDARRRARARRRGGYII